MRRLCSFLVLLLLQGILSASRLAAQSPTSSGFADPSSTASSHGTTVNSANVISAAENQFLWTEAFSGSTNSQGWVMSLDSTVGYVFSRHFGLDAGLPVY